MPGCNVYEISKFDGTIDAVELEKVSGHSTFICIMPHKIFDLMKNEYNVSISYSSDNNCFYFESSEILICLRFSFSQLGTKVFINNLSIIFLHLFDVISFSFSFIVTSRFRIWS